MWSYVRAAAGVSGLYLAPRWPRLGWSVNIAAQALWFTYGLATHQYGFLISSGFYSGAYLLLLRATRKKQLETPAGFEPAKNCFAGSPVSHSGTAS